MDNLLASQFGILIASVPARYLSSSLASPLKPPAASSYPSSRKLSRCVASHLTATPIGAPNTSNKNNPRRQQS